MRIPSASLFGLLLASLLNWALPATALAAPPGADAEDFFEQHVRPVLLASCVDCHGPDTQESDVRVDNLAHLLKGNDNGPLLVPGQPEKSRLVEVIGYQGDIQMPPDGKLSEEAIAALTNWVKMGAPWPEKQQTISRETAAQEHWAFQPVSNPPAPAAPESGWAKTAIDQFVVARLAENGLQPNPPADRRTLLRRVYFDLVGLPPTPEETEAFVHDPDPEAFAHVVDRLLQSPHFGERWGRYWLDVARYADTKGYVFQEERNLKYAYIYRDWVVDAFNRDLPYDQFLKYQLAADQLVSEGDRHPLAAMGLLTVGRRFLNNKHDIIDDRIDVVMRGTMGLTVACARCHDHKYDPIPTADYYSLYGVFAASQEKTVPLEPPSEEYQQELQ